LGRIEVRPVRPADARLAGARVAYEARIRGGRRHAGRLTQLGHDFAAMRDQNVLAAADHPQMLAEAVLQLPNADRYHVPIVARCGYNACAGFARLTRTGVSTMRPPSLATSKYRVPGKLESTSAGSVNRFLDVSLASIVVLGERNSITARKAKLAQSRDAASSRPIITSVALTIAVASSPRRNPSSSTASRVITAVSC